VIHPLVRSPLVAAIGAIAGALCLTVLYMTQPELRLDFDRELPRRTSAGLYPPERDGGRTFAWTSQRADFRFAGMDRTTPWTCTIRFRGGREDPAAQPTIEVSADGITLGRKIATNEFEVIEVVAPARPQQSGVVLTVTSSAVHVPGPSDPRPLGVQIDELACRPTDGRALPPRAAVRAAALSAAAVGAALGLGISCVSAVSSASLVALAQALPLGSGIAPYTVFPATATRTAIWIAIGLIVSLKLSELRRGAHTSRAARFVLVFSASALYLKLLGLLHPSKLLVDALFHAHRFQAVLAGNYYFTQVMPSGVTFPYSIGLYVVAAPWAVLTRDHVMLLRIVVSVAEVVAGALLYVLVVKEWKDRLVAALSVVLFHCVPLPYGLVGSANLTSAFGQSVALMTVIAAASLPLQRRGILSLGGLFIVASLAFLSHIGTAALTVVTLLALCVLYRVLGDSSTKRTALWLLSVTFLAGVFSWGIYYAHFTDVYATALQRMRASSAATTSTQSFDPDVQARTVPGQGRSTTVPDRTAHALGLTATAIGWPIVILAIIGVHNVWRSASRDRLTLLLAAWGTAYLVFLAVGVLPRVDAPFQRYAAEFVGRVVFATYAAAVVLGARGAASGLRGRLVSRLGTVACLVWSILSAIQHWRGWFV
jgi:hypothetical protein